MYSKIRFYSYSIFGYYSYSKMTYVLVDVGGWIQLILFGVFWFEEKRAKYVINLINNKIIR